jgi:hypothetical protein
MNWLYLAAGLLSVVVAAVHTILGELWVFRRMRRGTLVPTHGGNVLREPHVRILWASWHVLSVFGLAMAAMLLHSAYRPGHAWAPPAIAISMAVASVLVGFGTRGKHLGWVGLLGVAVLTALGSLLGP